MEIKELIDELKKYPSDLEVFLELDSYPGHCRLLTDIIDDTDSPTHGIVLTGEVHEPPTIGGYALIQCPKCQSELIKSREIAYPSINKVYIEFDCNSKYCDFTGRILKGNIFTDEELRERGLL